LGLGPAGHDTAQFAALDWVILGGFAASVAALGLFTKLRESRFAQFLAAGRSLSLPVFVATLVSTWYGGILGVGESVHDFGVGSWLLLGVPYYVFGVVYAVWFAGKVRSDAELSLPERLERVWGRRVGLVTAILVLLLALPAAHVYMLGVLLQFMSGVPLWFAVPFAALVGAAFLVRGGLLADAKMGVLAFIAMYVGFLAIDLVCLGKINLADGLHRLDTPALLRLDGGQGPIAVLTFFILGAWTLVDPAFHQRVASCESPKVGRQGVLVAVVCWAVFDILSIGAGLFALVGLHHPPENPVATFPAFGDQVLPPGLKGLFFIGMAGAILSGLVGYTLVSGATIGREILGRAFPAWPEDKQTRWSRVGLFIAGLLAVALALFVGSVVDLWYSWAGALVGALLLPVCFAYLARAHKLSPNAIVASMLLAFSVSFGLLVYSKRTQNDFLTVSWLGQTFSLGTLIPALAVSATVLGLAAIVERTRGRRTTTHG
jgi:SSS family solute:Na+ symporter